MAPDDLAAREDAAIRSHGRPGLIAYLALAIATAVALIGAGLAFRSSTAAAAEQRRRLAAAAEANCRATEALSLVSAGNLARVTAARDLGPAATPEQRAAQERINAEAARYRDEQSARLQAVRCEQIGQTAAPELAPVLVETPPTIVGAAGDRGATGLTGPAGLPGKDSQVPGAAGKDGASIPGPPGVTVEGPRGAKGDPGEPAPTTTVPPTTTTTLPATTTTTTCLLGVLCPAPRR